MNIDNFEKKAKDLFSRYRPEADHEQIWLQIEPKLKKKKKRRFLLLFFWAAGLSLLLGGLFWGHQQGRASATRDTHEAPMPLATAPALPQAAVMPPNSAIKAEARERRLQAAPTSKQAHATMPKGGVKAPLQASAGQQQGASYLSPHLTEGAQALAMEPSLGAVSDVSPDAVQQALDAPGPISALRAHHENETADTKLPDEAPLDSSDATPLRPWMNKSTKEGATPSKSAKPKKAPHKKARKKKSTLTHAIAWQTGLLLPFKQLEDKAHTTASETLLRNRNATEKSLEAISAGLQYTMATKKGLTFKAGLDYMRLNEKFHTDYTEKKVEVIQGVLSITVDGAGAIIDQTMGSKTVTTTKEYSNTAYNRFQFFNLPLGMGYQKTNKKRGWEISAGFDVNLSTRFQGTQFNTAGYPSAYVYPGTTGIYKRNIGLGAWGAYGYAWKLNRRLNWQASVRASVPFRSVSANAYALSQRYFYMGLHTGLSFNLTPPEKRKHKGHRR